VTAEDLDADARVVATGVGRVVDAVGQAESSAHEAARRAHAAEQQLPAPVTHEAAAAARAAEADADEALAEAREAEEKALAVAEEADELLLEKDARELAAQVSEDQPFGVPGRKGDRSSPFRWGFTVTAGALLALVLGLAIATVEHELLLIVIAAFVAIGLDPAVRFLVRRGMRRSFAVAAIVFAFLAAVAGFVAAAVPPLVAQATQLSSKGPGYLKQLNDKHTLLGRLNLEYHVSDNLQRKVSGSGLSAGGVLHAGTVVLSATFETIIVLALVIYFLADLTKIKIAVYRLFPKHRRPRVGLLGDEIIARVGGYVLGNVLTSLVAIVGSYVVLLILGVPYALVLSILVGVLDLIPLVGSTIGGAIVALVALATVSGTAAAITIGYHVFYRLFADYVLNPRVLRRTVDVSPVVTVVAVLIGGALLGVTGALIAVPAAAAIQLVLVEVVYPQRDSEAAA
jgi:predicted PurR-regulated permease PerM